MICLGNNVQRFTHMWIDFLRANQTNLLSTYTSDLATSNTKTFQLHRKHKAKLTVNKSTAELFESTMLRPETTAAVVAEEVDLVADEEVEDSVAEEAVDVVVEEDLAEDVVVDEEEEVGIRWE